MMHISIKQGAATHGAHNYRPGTQTWSTLMILSIEHKLVRQIHREKIIDTIAAE